jgi:hypothetical protein
MSKHLIEKIISVYLEEFPTNSMGTSSSTSGTGPVDTFDPILGLKRKLARRKKPVDNIKKIG